MIRKLGAAGAFVEHLSGFGGFWGTLVCFSFIVALKANWHVLNFKFLFEANSGTKISPLEEISKITYSALSPSASVCGCERI